MKNQFCYLGNRLNTGLAQIGNR